MIARMVARAGNHSLPFHRPIRFVTGCKIKPEIDTPENDDGSRKVCGLNDRNRQRGDDDQYTDLNAFNAMIPALSFIG